ncbi:MAG: WecB/TagA/CpsF family glycosyltransferase [Candidatus Saccharibacteria bacterium]
MPKQIISTEVLGCRVDVVDMAQAVQTVETAIHNRTPLNIVTLNAEMIYQAQNDRDLMRLYAQAGLVTPDGIGTVWALRRQGYAAAERVTGIDLSDRIIQLAVIRNWGIFLLGGQPSVADKAAEALQIDYPGLRIVGTHHGYFPENNDKAIVEQIRQARPEVLLAALGAPKQDYWIEKYLAELEVPVCIGIGGSLDVWSGNTKRAPAFWQRAGLEWLYRLISEPSRIKRQIVLPMFAFKVLVNGKR